MNVWVATIIDASPRCSLMSILSIAQWQVFQLLDKALIMSMTRPRDGRILSIGSHSERQEKLEIYEMQKKSMQSDK